MMLVVPTWVTVDLGVDYGIEKNFTITFVVFLVFSLGCICVCFNNLMVCVLVRHLYFSFSLCSSYVCGRSTENDELMSGPVFARSFTKW